MGQRYRSVLTDRVFLGVLIIGGMTFSGLFSYLSASSFLFQQSFGFDAQQYGLLFAANSLGLVAGVQIASRLAARYGPQWVLAWSTSTLVVAGVAIILADQIGLGLWGILVLGPFIVNTLGPALHGTLGFLPIFSTEPTVGSSMFAAILVLTIMIVLPGIPRYLFAF